MRRREELEGEERDVDHATIATAGYGTGVTVTAEQVAAWYDAHKADYMTQETVDLQYLELDLAYGRGRGDRHRRSAAQVLR
jgi:hypothetical protein